MHFSNLKASLTVANQLIQALIFEGCVRISCIIFRVFFWLSTIKNLADSPSYGLVQYELFLKLF